MTSKRGGPEKIGSILERVLEQSGLLKPDQHEEIVRAWREVAGETVGKLTHVLSYRSGTLTVGVESAPLFQELSTYQKDEMLAALRNSARGTGIQELRFKLV